MEEDPYFKILKCDSCGKQKKIVSQSYARKDKYGNYIPRKLYCEDCVNKEHPEQ
ncbi:MAG: hypothetical protein ACAH23_00525 [Nitrososphaeraceae archaeon]